MNGGTTPVRVTARAVQIGLGIIWVVDGLLQLQPKMFGTGFADNVILPSAQGQPGIVSGMITHLAHLMSAQPVLTDLVFAGIQLLIGAGLLLRETVKPALVLSFVWALGVWSVGEGFGGLLTGTAQPLTGAPGAALLYLAIALLVWPKKEPREVDGPAAAEGLLGVGGGLALWAVVWCGLGILWLLPASSGSGALSSALKGAASGEPGWLARLQLSVAHSLGNGASVAVAAALLCFFIGVGPLIVRRYGIFLIAGAAMALDIWVLGQAFGQIFTGMATDPNTGPLLILLALTVYPNGAPARAPDRLSPEPSTGTGVLTPRPASAGRGR
ncbi:MAG: hypothetical protein ACLQRH_08485 [Acidimicrobiales bacterium]|jgi:hypothetical protein